MPVASMSVELFERSWWDVRERDEQVGFFLASFEPDRAAFVVRDWRVIPSDGFEVRTGYHVTLTDEARLRTIAWAWETGLSLVEVHSHAALLPAQFSLSDIRGLREWVPHLMWRLRERPYSALVVAGDEFDGLAWIHQGGAPELLEAIELTNGTRVRATGLTLRSLSSFEPTRNQNA